MRRWWRLQLLPVALGLVGCGSLDTPVPLQAGELLAAPTTLNVAGRLLRAQATPTVQGEQFRVQVRVQTARPPLPALNVTGVFVVTDSGVWKAPVSAATRQNCGAKLCIQGTGLGSSAGIQIGEDVQVVTRLQDGKGRVLWLRDEEVRVSRAVP